MMEKINFIESPKEWRSRLEKQGGLQRFDSEEAHAGPIPNSTAVPNEFLDFHLSVIGFAPLKVLLYITRKTYGFSKAGKTEGDFIPLSQILNGTKIRDSNKMQDYGTGLSKKSALQAIHWLEKAGLIEVIRKMKDKNTREINYYRLVRKEK